MEILSYGKETAGHVYLLILLGLIILVLCTISISLFVDWFKGKADSNGKVGAVICGIVAIGCMTAWGFLTNKGAEEYWKVYITDINEVHEQGYIITDQEGKIFTITKE